MRRGSSASGSNSRLLIRDSGGCTPGWRVTPLRGAGITSAMETNRSLFIRSGDHVPNGDKHASPARMAGDRCHPKSWLPEREQQWAPHTQRSQHANGAIPRENRGIVHRRLTEIPSSLLELEDRPYSWHPQDATATEVGIILIVCATADRTVRALGVLLYTIQIQ